MPLSKENKTLAIETLSNNYNIILYYITKNIEANSSVKDMADSYRIATEAYEKALSKIASE